LAIRFFFFFNFHSFFNFQIINFKTCQENAEMFPLGADGQMLPSEIDYIETWKGMEHVTTKGLTKSIGLSNFNSQQVKRVLDHCTIRPVCNQVIFINSVFY